MLGIVLTVAAVLMVIFCAFYCSDSGPGLDELTNPGRTNKRSSIKDR